MMKVNFPVDEDTIVVLRLISRYLRKYFEYDSEEEVVAIINNFYSKMRPFFSDETEEDFLNLNFHHDHPFLVASRIHYQNNSALQQKYSDVVSWLREINWFNVPAEAQLDYKIWSDLEKGN